MEKLKEETLKMLKKIESLIDKIEIVDSRGEGMLTNMKAYISDSKHFLDNKDFIKAFESIVWSWAILEICEELGIFKIEK
ncbi:MAG: DUF357 domain-containing protein [Candidatus Aenigmarchaeota archaeon]|nr:DUF357 domain-containing protein [Candidatus Aenigmarchaeota archaeon]